MCIVFIMLRRKELKTSYYNEKIFQIREQVPESARNFPNSARKLNVLFHSQCKQEKLLPRECQSARRL